MRTIYLQLSVIVAASLSTASFATGTLIASGDEWQLSNVAYGVDTIAGTEALVNNLALNLGGSDYLFLTGNTNVPQSMLTSAASQFESLGKTIDFSATFDPVADAGYDAVFHFGQVVNPDDFATYVNNGGNAYVSLGGGWLGDAAAEAALWNPVLAQYGLIAGDTWFPYQGFAIADITVGPSDTLLWGYGQSIEKLTPQSPSQSYVRGSFSGGPVIGLIGTSRPFAIPGVPEPASWALLIAGFGLVGMASRRRTRLAPPIA